MKQDNTTPILVKCACGCGKEFKPNRKWHIYFETKCRVSAFFERQAKDNDELISIYVTAGEYTCETLIKEIEIQVRRFFPKAKVTMTKIGNVLIDIREEGEKLEEKLSDK